MSRLIRTFFLLLLIFFSAGTCCVHAQPKDSMTINVAAIKSSQKIWKQVRFFSSAGYQPLPAELFVMHFEDSIPPLYRVKIPAGDIKKTFYFKFDLSNEADTAVHCYFLPGFFMEELDLYKKNAGSDSIHIIAQGSPLHSEYPGVIDFWMKPKEKFTVVAKLKVIRASVNYFRPRITQSFYMPLQLNTIRNTNRLAQVFTFITVGVLMSMIFYSLAVFFLNNNRNFILYCGHAFFLSVLFFLKAYLYRVPSEFNYFFECYLDFVLQSASFYFFLFFLRKFTNSKEKYPAIEKILLANQVFTVLGLCVFSYLYFFTTTYMAMNSVEMIIKYSWSLAAAFFILFAIIKKQRLLSLIAIGHFLLLLFVVISLYLIHSDYRFGPKAAPLLNDSLFYYEMGVLAELIFFLIALAFKNRQDIIHSAIEKERLELAHQRNELEKQIAIIAAQQDERNRISEDMHDELGSGVTAIRLMSELVKAKMKENALPEIDRISSSANELINKMNTIIWTMKSTNDSIDNLAAYIRSYALEYCENTNMDCCFNYPVVMPAIELSGEKRRNIFLCIKETLNNAAKHARATEIRITIEVEAALVLTIRDNGVGIDMENIREFGNGIVNMRKRMTSIDGSFDINKDKGTVTILSLRV